jgi:hypothetical protein
MWAKEDSKVNNRPVGENSHNLVTLILPNLPSPKVHYEKAIFGSDDNFTFLRHFFAKCLEIAIFL